MNHRVNNEQIAEAAKIARGHFEWIDETEAAKRLTRPNIWVEKAGAPEWVDELIRAAHDGKFPNDYTYEYVVEALDYLADNDGDADDYDPEPDIYNTNLLQWLASNLNRVGYVDDARHEYGQCGTGIMAEIGLGQVTEKREVMGLVHSWLEDSLDDVLKGKETND